MAENQEVSISTTQADDVLEPSAAVEWRPRPSGGWQIPAGVSAVALVVFTAGLVYLFSRPIALDSFAAALAVLASLILALAAAMLSYGSYSARYRLDPDALVVDWFWMTEVVPLVAIERLYSGRRLGEKAKVEGFSWPGYYFGRAQADDIGWVKFRGTSLDPSEIVIVATATSSYALTPDDQDRFRESLIERLESLDQAETQEAAGATSFVPALLRLSVLRDGIVLVLLCAAAVVLLASYGYLSARLPGLPHLIALTFNQAGDPNIVGPPQDAFRMPIIGTFILIANAAIVAALHGRHIDASRLLAGSTVFVQLVMLVAVLKVVQ